MFSIIFFYYATIHSLYITFYYRRFSLLPASFLSFTEFFLLYFCIGTVLLYWFFFYLLEPFSYFENYLCSFVASVWDAIFARLIPASRNYLGSVSLSQRCFSSACIFSFSVIVRNLFFFINLTTSHFPRTSFFRPTFNLFIFYFELRISLSIFMSLVLMLSNLPFAIFFKISAAYKHMALITVSRCLNLTLNHNNFLL